MSTEAISRGRNLVSSPKDRDERAQAAVKVFRSMQFALTGYARAITGDKRVRVEIDGGVPRTDGKVIYYRPPIALGDKTPHDRYYCDKRGDDGLQLCPACKVREEVLVNIYHEIAHIAFDSFGEADDAAKAAAIRAAVDQWGGSYAEQINKMFERAPVSLTRSYYGLAQLISPFMPHLLNCLDDARVDSSMFRARKGTRKMLTADTFSLLRDGIPQADGEMKHHSEAPLNSQAALACYLAGAGYVGWEQYLHEKIGQDFKDRELMHMLTKVRTAPAIGDVYALSFGVLARLRELGYFLTPEEQQEQEKPDEPKDKQEGNTEDEAESSATPEASPESDESEGQAEADASSAGSSNPGQESSTDDSGEDAEDSEGDDSGEAGSDESAGASEDADSDSGSPEAGEEPAEEPDGGVEPGDQAGEGAGEDSEPSGDGGDDQPSEPSEGPDAGVGDDSEDSGEAPEQPGQGAPSEETPEGDEEGSAGMGDGSTEGEAVDDADSDEVPEGSDAGPGPDGESDAGAGPGAGDSEADQSPDGEPDSTEDGSDGGGDPHDGDQVGEDLAGPGGDAAGEGDRQLDEHNGDREAGEEQVSDETGGDTGEPSDAQLGDVDHPADAGEGADDDGDRPDGVDVFESGADQGLGGVEVDAKPLPEYGTEQDVAAALEAAHADHGDQQADAGDQQAEQADQAAIVLAIIQGMYFETPSLGVGGVEEHHYGPGVRGWDKARFDSDSLLMFGVICDMEIPEGVLGPMLLKTRRIFSDNKTSSYQPNLKSGRINNKVLGRRAWSGDDRLFGKKRIPAKKDYAVQIMVDISSSNLGDNLALLKRAVKAQAELLHRAGVEFSVMAHSASGNRFGTGDYVMHLHHIKSFDEPWNDEVQNRWTDIVAVGGNLDGHAMEYARKELLKTTATDKILMYYTDGKMPAANKDEELEVLQRQIKLAKRDGITLMGVGIRTDSPIRHGLDTVEVHDDDDLKKVVEHLGKRLARSAR